MAEMQSFKTLSFRCNFFIVFNRAIFCYSLVNLERVEQISSSKRTLFLFNRAMQKCGIVSSLSIVSSSSQNLFTSFIVQHRFVYRSTSSLVLGSSFNIISSFVFIVLHRSLRKTLSASFLTNLPPDTFSIEKQIVCTKWLTARMLGRKKARLEK